MFCCVLSFIYYTFYAFIPISLTLFLALFVSEPLRKWVMAFLFTSKFLTTLIKKQFYVHRKRYLKNFTELKPQKPNGKLNVLEVGVGAGTNFDLYPDNCKLTVLDYNDNFKKEFMKSIEKYPKIEFETYLTGTVEDMNQLEDNTFDVVLSTHLFCSVGDVTKGLNEVKRVLKPGGQYFFFEHVAYHQEHFKDNLVYYYVLTLIQYIITQFWRLIFCGCELNRKTWIQIQNTKFTSLNLYHDYPKSVILIIRPQVYGCALK